MLSVVPSRSSPFYHILGRWFEFLAFVMDPVRPMTSSLALLSLCRYYSRIIQESPTRPLLGPSSQFCSFRETQQFCSRHVAPPVYLLLFPFLKVFFLIVYCSLSAICIWECCGNHVGVRGQRSRVRSLSSVCCESLGLNPRLSGLAIIAFFPQSHLLALGT